MGISKDFQGATIMPPGDYFGKKVESTEMRKIVKLYGYGGGYEMEENFMHVPANDSTFAWAIVKYKSMEELIKEFPNYYFDQYGNFNTGVTVKSRFNHDESSVYDHLAPSYFGQMGHILHRRYVREEGIKDTWYYTVIDR